MKHGARILDHAIWRPDVAIDIGTATTRIATKLHGPVVRQSKVGDLSALRSGVVVNRDVAVAVLEPILDGIKSIGILRPRAVACAPTDASANEREMIIDIVSRAGASAVVVVPEPLAAAIGGGIDVSSTSSQMIIDIGEGVTDCAIIKSGKIIETSTIRMGCGTLRNSIRETVARQSNSQISEYSAERILREVGISGAVGTGSNVSHALERDELIGASALQSGGEREIWASLELALAQIFNTIVMFLKNIPHSIGCELIDSGIHLTGGGSLLAGMRERVQEETRINTITVQNPLNAVVLGARMMLPIVGVLNMWKH
ncbi:rod shape-determining protein [Geobacter sp.]|uniref:rod shape-determining protein n=1 Tax=Geobacter sp. TaxID=46610 RepID=UPI0027B958A5|nr:rod shape-determining protein [Geobacter sp.]